MLGDLFYDRSAAFSPCRRYRYTLRIVWDASLPVLNLCMLNPSTADEFANDPTVERCERRARAMTFGALIVTNLFAWRDTEPKNLYGLQDPVGPENDTSIAAAARESALVICGWGANAEKIMPGRAAIVLSIIRAAGAVPHALKTNGDGSPQHPLYIGYGVQPRPLGEDGA